MGAPSVLWAGRKCHAGTRRRLREGGDPGTEVSGLVAPPELRPADSPLRGGGALGLPVPQFPYVDGGNGNVHHGGPDGVVAVPAAAVKRK